MNIDDLVAFLEARLDDDARTAQADERHWSEIPDRLFSKPRALDDIRAKRAVVKALVRCTDHRWTGTYAVVTVAREALQAMVQPYVDHPEFDPSWKIDDV